jgi:hypothetical protein
MFVMTISLMMSVAVAVWIVVGLAAVVEATFTAAKSFNVSAINLL